MGIIALLLLGWLFPQCGKPPLLTIAPEVGALAPDFVLSSLEGQEVRLSKLRGRPVLLHFWTTWCRPCRREMGYLQKAFKEKGKEINFLAINLGEPAGKVREFVNKEGIDFTIALDKGMVVKNIYNIRYIPTTFFIDEQGVICQVKVGAFSNFNELMTMFKEVKWD